MTSRMRQLAITSLAVVAMAIPVVVAAPSQAARPNGVAIAIGDSVPAGLRAGVQSTTPYGFDCGRSDVAYPNQVGERLGLTTYNLACTGAQNTVGVSGPQIGPFTGVMVPSQLDQAAGLPPIKFAMVQSGANDVAWDSMLGLCISPLNCATQASTALYQQRLAAGSVAMDQVLYRLVKVMGADHVSLVGYYDPLRDVPRSAPQLAGLTDAEVAWYLARLDELNSSLRANAKRFSHVNYVPVSLSAAAGEIQLSGLGMLHPTGLGHGKITQAVLRDYSCCNAS